MQSGSVSQHSATTIYDEPFPRTLLGHEFACHITILRFFCCCCILIYVTTDDAFCHDFQQNAIEYNTNVSTELYGSQYLNCFHFNFALTKY